MLEYLGRINKKTIQKWQTHYNRQNQRYLWRQPSRIFEGSHLKSSKRVISKVWKEAELG